MAMLAGTERVVSTKINWLASHGYDVCLVTYEQGHHSLVLPIHPSVKIFDLDVCFWALYSLSLFHRFFRHIQLKSLMLERLKAVVEDFAPDVILTTTYSLHIAEEIYKVRRNAKLIIESHETCSFVIKENSYISNPFLKIVAKFYDKQNLRYVNQFDRLVTLTRGDANEWQKYLSINSDVIPNPLPLFPVSYKKVKSQYYRIIAAGRLEAVKGFDRLIKSFSIIADKCPKWKIDIYGNGSCHDSLMKLVSHYHMENRITILPPTNDIYKEYLNSDFYVLSSHHEGLGMVLLEAMSCGLPCVSFNCDYGPREVIVDRETGLLVENGNIEKLAQAILWMIDHQNNRLQMGIRARDSVKRYQMDIIMERWVNLFNSL